MIPTTIELESNNELMANTMSKSGFDFNTAMFELIDNSIAAGARNIDIQFWIEPTGQKPIHQIHISDDGSGFPLDSLSRKLAMGAETGVGINEHGVGLKNAIGYYGGNDIRAGLLGIVTYDGEDCYEITGYEGNMLTLREISPAWPNTGSCVKINCLELEAALSNRWKKLVDMLGVRYGDYIESGITITVSLVDIETLDEIEDGEHEVEPIFPPYYNPLTRTETHLWEDEVQNYTGSVRATLTIGLSPEGEEGIWERGIYKGGIDVVQDGRVVVHRSYQPLESWRRPHPMMNGVVGRLVIHTGYLPTTPKKDGFRETQEYIELRESIASSVRGSIIPRVLDLDDEEAERYEEADMRRGLKLYLESLTTPSGEAVWDEVNDEDATDTGLSMDVTAVTGGEKWVFEIKKETFGAQDMNQLIGYMIATHSIKGVVFSPNVLDNATRQLEYWREALSCDIDIQYWDSRHNNHRTVMRTYVGVEQE